MDKIKMNRETLLEKLRENRKKHKDEFDSALKVWKKQAAKALKRAAKKAESTGWINQYPLENLPKPQSYLKSYDDAIVRVELDTRDELELDDRTFAAWVQDDWHWRGAFIGTTSVYNSVGAR